MPAPRLVAAGGLEVTRRRCERELAAGRSPGAQSGRRGGRRSPQPKEGANHRHNRDSARRARSTIVIGYGWQVIESSSGREVTPTLYRKTRTHDEGAERAPRSPRGARRDPPAEAER